MRALALAITAMLLAACDSNDVPSPAERLEGEVAAPVDEGQVSLRADGLTAGAESFFFAAGQAEVETALTRVLGAPSQTAEMEECGAGPMNSASYADGLTVNFQDGILVGWFVQEASPDIAVSADVALEMPRDQLEALPGYSPIADSTLGEEFVISGQIAGFVEGDAVSTLYAGTQCFFR
ncbi:aspartate-semialdehyde dehydrogenase [uncultured Erythrobacter sp.]|uniref:aspartate-semialdehyde dehydrogenase n=1 Tax=uncultured Erythrobacter sp. TaxID=263913 RepID=UPI00261602A0|nr:aspartate-semialdehyde dehydrogenase [uncultured Erythrobacter sp.]